MKKVPFLIFAVLFLTSPLHASVVDDLVSGYQAAEGGDLTTASGEALWKKQQRDAASGKMRSCAVCHGQDLRQNGKHVRTGKAIDAMAPSVNPKRLTDAAFIEKWFKRNCQWTWGRACTAREKGQILRYLEKQ